MTDIDWHEHARLIHFADGSKRNLAAGELRAMVDVALVMGAAIENLAIETDGGRTFCRYEIEYISLLASRPKAAGVTVQ